MYWWLNKQPNNGMESHSCWKALDLIHQDPESHPGSWPIAGDTSHGLEVQVCVRRNEKPWADRPVLEVSFRIYLNVNL